MTREYKLKVFCIIRNNVSKKHPDWSQKRINAVAKYCLGKSYKRIGMVCTYE